MLQTNEILPHDMYLRTLFSHRFCLVVRGDANGTPKLTEVLAAAGAVRTPSPALAACLSVLTPPTPTHSHPHRITSSARPGSPRPPPYRFPGIASASRSTRSGLRLQGGCVPVFVFDKGSRFPYDTVLDYCQLGFFVFPSRAETRLSEVLDALERLTPAQVEAKRTALRRARHRFVFRNDSSFAHPSAAEHTYEQVCAALRGTESTMKRAWRMDQCEL
jgi:hypothetical protein